MMRLIVAALLCMASVASASADTAAISPPLSKKCQLMMKASSGTESRPNFAMDWGIYVQQVTTNTGRIKPVALIAYFQFGRPDNPWEYPVKTSTVAPIIDAPDYRIAVYFFDKRGATLQEHSHGNNLSNGGWDLKLNPDGSPAQMTATYWDDERDHSAQIHKIVIDFVC